MQECGTGADDHTQKVVYSMGRDHLDAIIENARRDGCGRFGPTPDRVLGAAIGWVAVAIMHTPLIVYGPRDMRELLDQIVLNREVSF